MRFTISLSIALMIAAQLHAANVEQVPAKGAESLGNRLLDDLSPETPAPVAPQQSQQLAAQQAHGFGASENPLAAPLTQVRQGMQGAEALLAQPRLDAKSGSVRLAGTVQEKVLSDLDQLIAKLSKQCQCQGGQCNGGQCNSDKPCDKPGQKPGKPGSAKGSGKTAAKDSSDRLDRTTAKAVDKGEVDAMVKAIWGQLPERSREQMQQSFSDEFLPKYELEIEQYYRHLSEEQSATPPKQP